MIKDQNHYSSFWFQKSVPKHQTAWCSHIYHSIDLWQTFRMNAQKQQLKIDLNLFMRNTQCTSFDATQIRHHNCSIGTYQSTSWMRYIVIVNHFCNIEVPTTAQQKCSFSPSSSLFKEALCTEIDQSDVKKRKYFEKN